MWWFVRGGGSFSSFFIHMFFHEYTVCVWVSFLMIVLLIY